MPDLEQSELTGARLTGRYATVPGQIPWPGRKAVLKRVYVAVVDAELSLRCAGVAFFSFMSLFPVMASIVLLYGLVTSRDSLKVQLDTIQPFVPASVFEMLQDRLIALLQQPETTLGVGLVVSLIFALWSGSRGINALLVAMNRAYREKDERGLIANALLSLGLTLGGMVFITIALFAIAAIPVIVGGLPLPRFLESLSIWLRWPVLALMVWLAISVLFRIAPNRSAAKWTWITPGAALSTLLWIGLSVLFSLYVENFGNYNAMFGSLSVAVVTLLWIYYSTLIIVLGAILNSELEYQTKIDTTTGVSAPMGQRGAFVADHIAEQKS